MLFIGQAIETNLYNLGLGYICAIHNYNEKDVKPITQISNVCGTGGSCDIDIIFMDGRKTNRYPECLIGGQFKLRNDIIPATAQTIRELQDLSDKYYALKAQEEKEEEQAFNNAMLDAKNDPQFKNLTQIDSKNRYNYKLLKSNYQKLLKMYFPETKFSIKKDGWLSIRVSWAGLPTEDQFKEKMDCMKEDKHTQIDDYVETVAQPFSSVFGCFDYVWLDQTFTDQQVQNAIDQLIDSNAYQLPAPDLTQYRNGAAARMPCLSSGDYSCWNWQRLINDELKTLK